MLHKRLAKKCTKFSFVAFSFILPYYNSISSNLTDHLPNSCKLIKAMNGIYFYLICVHLKIKSVKSYYFPVYVNSLIIIVATFIVQLIILTLEFFFIIYRCHLGGPNVCHITCMALGYEIGNCDNDYNCKCSGRNRWGNIIEDVKNRL